MTLPFRHFSLKNPILRASATGSSLDWERRYAAAGVGAIISSPVDVLPDDALRIWQAHIGGIHGSGCRYLLQLGLPATMRSLSSSHLTTSVRTFADLARRARETGADGVELQATRGSLFAQLLAPGVDDRPAEYQRSAENRGRLLREAVQAVRYAVGWDFHVQVRLGVTSPLGLEAAGTLHLVRALEADGLDAIHLADDGTVRDSPQGSANAFATRQVKAEARVPILRNGPFRTAQEISTALRDGSCDAVTLTRPLGLSLTRSAALSRAA